MTQFDPHHPVSTTKPLPAAVPRPGDTASSVAPGPWLPHPAPPPVSGPPVTYGYPPVVVVAPRQSDAEIVVAWIVTAITLLSMLPWAIAASRRSTNSVLIAVATFFLAWTVVGWFALLVLSFLGPTVSSTRPVVMVAPTGPATPPQPPSGSWAYCASDPPHVRRWWDGHAWTAHTTTG